MKTINELTNNELAIAIEALERHIAEDTSEQGIALSNKLRDEAIAAREAIAVAQRKVDNLTVNDLTHCELRTITLHAIAQVKENEWRGGTDSRARLGDCTIDLEDIYDSGYFNHELEQAALDLACDDLEEFRGLSDTLDEHADLLTKLEADRNEACRAEGDLVKAFSFCLNLHDELVQEHRRRLIANMVKITLRIQRDGEAGEIVLSKSAVDYAVAIHVLQPLVCICINSLDFEPILSATLSLYSDWLNEREALSCNLSHAGHSITITFG